MITVCNKCLRRKNFSSRIAFSESAECSCGGYYRELFFAGPHIMRDNFFGTYTLNKNNPDFFIRAMVPKRKKAVSKIEYEIEIHTRIKESFLDVRIYDYPIETIISIHCGSQCRSRILNILDRNRIFTISDLTNHTYEELGILGLGRKSIMEIRMALAIYGLSLFPSTPIWKRIEIQNNYLLKNDRH